MDWSRQGQLSAINATELNGRGQLGRIVGRLGESRHRARPKTGTESDRSAPRPSHLSIRMRLSAPALAGIGRHGATPGGPNGFISVILSRNRLARASSAIGRRHTQSLSGPLARDCKRTAGTNG